MNYLKKLYIESFFNDRDVVINFNKNLSILVGGNGCGKTTILSLLDNVLNFKIEEIISYTFKKVILETENWSFEIIKTNNNVKFTLIKAGESPKIKDIELKKQKKDSKKKFVWNYSEIEETFNESEKVQEFYLKEVNKFHKFIPLDRTYSYISSKRNKKYLFEETKTESLFTLDSVINLIEKKSKINSAILSKLDENFKKKIMKLPFEVSTSHDLEVKFKNILDFNKEKKEEILRIYSNLGIEEKKIDVFFNKVLEYNSVIKKNKIKNVETLIKGIGNKEFENRDLLGFFLTDTRLEFSEKMLEYAKENKEGKKRNKKEFTLFIDVLNNFFKENKKIILFDHINELKIQKNSKKINLENLSSGEKQLITMFGFLIFGEKSNNVYMIDEPELSLHIDWQRKLSNKLLSINEKNQYIFATHSPSIIGEYSECCIDLEV